MTLANISGSRIMITKPNFEPGKHYLYSDYRVELLYWNVLRQSMILGIEKKIQSHRLGCKSTKIIRRE
jgi:hypothetical protein